MRRLSALIVSAVITAAAPVTLMAAQASAATGPVIGSDTTCSAGVNSYCLTAQVSVVGPSSCYDSHGNDYYQTIDGNGRHIDYTYAHGSSACTYINYPAPPLPANATCKFYVYVPNSDATAYLYFGLYDFTGRKYINKVNEEPVSGWQLIGSGGNLSGRVDFADNNGQSYPTVLGWGNNSGDGIWEVC